MPETKPARRNFTLIFIIVLGLISAVVFFAFRNMMRRSVEQRSEVSRAHLLILHKAMKAYAQKESSFPADLVKLANSVERSVFYHPAWPDRPGYVYVTGLRASDDPQSIAIFENVPAEKVRLPRLLVTLGGEVQSLDKNQLEERLAKQESIWRADKRQWLLQPVDIDLLMEK